MKKLNEKIKDLKILLAQNNEITTKTKFLLKQTPTDFLNKFFENKISFRRAVSAGRHARFRRGLLRNA